jgi:hypothetical protein
LAQIKRLEIGRKCIWRGCIDDRLEHFFSQVGTDPEEYLKVASDKNHPAGGRVHGRSGQPFGDRDFGDFETVERRLPEDSGDGDA